MYLRKEEGKNLAPKLSASSMTTDELIRRPSANFAPSLWVDRFSSIVNIDDQTKDKWLKEVEELKTQVRCLLTKRTTVVEEKLALVDILERLGISYLFQNEIEDELKEIYTSSQIETNEKHDLSVVSLYFRLLRQHGYLIPSQIFHGFKDKDGFKSLLRTDVKGLLNLYEAAQTRIHGEDSLEEALTFASTNIELMIPHLPASLTKICVHTLEKPTHKCIPRLEATFFISHYEDEGEESKNDVVIRLAKLDHNLLQIFHREELAEIYSWWKDLIPMFPYARDRMVELYFWAVGVHFEPQYSLSRVMFTKTLCLITLSDDTHDTYGTVDELKIFNQVVERWDISEIDRLPEYMKALYKALMLLYVSFEDELETLGRSYAISYLKETLIEVIQNQFIEAKWFIEGHIPDFDMYLKVSMITSTFYMLTVTSLLGMKSATKESFEWLKTNPKISLAGATICRLTNDMASYEIEKKRGQITTGIDCYMKEYGVTEEEAMHELKKMVENAWKDLNECYLRPMAAAPDDITLMQYVVNLTRIGETTYKNKIDGVTNPAKGLKAYIIAILVDSFNV